MDIDRDIESIREDFPVLKYKTYMNSAAHGPTLRPVWEAVQNWWRYRMDEDRGARTPDAKGEAAKLLHVDPEEVCWVTRVTEGLNMVASMMKLNRGENVVVTDLAYPSNVFVWLPFREKGVEIRRVKHREGRISVEDFEKAVDDKSRVVCVSRVEWTSGLRYDMKTLAEIAHDHDAYLVDDSYQAVGAIDVDVHKDNIDFLTVGSEKWLCSPSFAGIFYIRKDLIDDFEPSFRFYETVEGAFSKGAPWESPRHDNIADYDKDLMLTADKFYRGSVSEEAVWGFHGSLRYFNSLGLGNLERRIGRLSGYLIEGLRRMGVKVNTPIETKDRAGLVTYTTGKPELDSEIFRALQSNSIIIALRYAGGVGGIRVSTHFFNNEEDIDRLLKVQKEKLS